MGVFENPGGSMKKVSIIIVTAGREQLLTKCLTSLVASISRTYGPAADFESIIVLNNPCSAARHVAEQVLSKQRYKVIDLPDRVHPGAGRNQAINIAEGEWLFCRRRHFC